MNERHIAEKNKILVVKTGSHMYGTNTPESDEDFVGIFMPSEEYVYGFKRVDEVDMSVKDKNENGKNTKDAIDIKYYEFRKFVKLAMENNPNILEILFAPKENIIFYNDIGAELIRSAWMFPHQGAKQKFLGYAFSQKHKMFIKKDNYFDLIKAKEFLKRFAPTPDHVGNSFSLWELEQCEMDKSVFVKQLNKRSGKTDFYAVGDINLMPSITVNNALKIVEERLDKVGNREELYLKHAYDTKFAMHLIRLMMEGAFLLKNGFLEFPFDDEGKKILMAIRNGEFAIEEVLKMADTIELNIENFISSLPEKPMYDLIEDYVITTIKEFLK
jgi:hypothetical protein